jgi:DNA-directed RNA polymerase subunit RPC12/RpoP
MGYECPCCGADSEVCYRCSECGHDLAKADSSVGREATQ